jgi:hypothetical protein
MKPAACICPTAPPDLRAQMNAAAYVKELVNTPSLRRRW